jgi:hypothetical protein
LFVAGSLPAAGLACDRGRAFFELTDVAPESFGALATEVRFARPVPAALVVSAARTFRAGLATPAGIATAGAIRALAVLARERAADFLRAVHATESFLAHTSERNLVAHTLAAAFARLGSVPGAVIVFAVLTGEPGLAVAERIGRLG